MHEELFDVQGHIIEIPRDWTRQKYTERGRDLFVVERDERRGRGHISLGLGQGLRNNNHMLTKRTASMECHTYLRTSLSLTLLMWICWTRG